MKKFMIKTLGCKVNQFESEAISAALVADGWEEAAAGPVSLCVVNTCTVTGRAAMQSRQEVRRCRRENPGALVIAAGCYATVDPEELRATGCLDLVVAHQAKHLIPDLVRKKAFSFFAARPPLMIDENDHPGAFPRYRPDPAGASDRARPYLKIQDGCEAFCTYCIVPHARGRSVSMPEDEVLALLGEYALSGYGEVVLTGIHLGAYGHDLPGSSSLLDLLRRIDRQKNLPRVRLSSIEPLELTDEIIDLVAASDRFCDHFHLPLQSGQDQILEKMGRPYRSDFFAGRVDRIKKRLPQAAIGADLLVGFPGEDAVAFEATHSLISRLPLTYLHVFPYSPRRGTPAFDYPGQVTPDLIKERCRLLRDLGEAKKQEFASSRVGTTAVIRVEEKRDPQSGCLKGVTSNYLTVLLDGGDELKGDLVKVLIGENLRGLRVRAYIQG